MSQSASVSLLTTVVGFIPISFGINAILRPEHALTFFEFEPPVAPSGRSLVDNLMIIYGVRDILWASPSTRRVFSALASPWVGR
ncbi:hypothetical protein V6Z77_009295 [Aspergillus fumigatus]